MNTKNYLESITKQFQYYKMLGERTFDQLNESDLFWQLNAESNSIAIIVNHLSGNMKSRWTDFLTTDGEKNWRNRDQEFEDIIKTEKELFNLRFQKQSGDLSNTSRFSIVRKNIAS